jgi:hypothetical protein
MSVGYVDIQFSNILGHYSRINNPKGFASVLLYQAALRVMNRAIQFSKRLGIITAEGTEDAEE